MAGTYPDLPAPRIEYDRDGTRVYWILGSTITELTSGQRRALNDESADSTVDISYNQAQSVLWVFPERRDITHLFLDIARDNSVTENAVVKISWSNDSTTGLDGTWTEVSSDWPEQRLTTNPRYRTDIAAIAGLADVKMVKVSLTSGVYFHEWRTVHMYGQATAGQNLHRLRLWHPTLDEPLDVHPAHLDWGNVPQESSDTRQFRVKNDSPNLTASGVKVFMDALTEASPTQISQHQLSLDNTTFVAATSPGLAVGTLQAQIISPPIYLRRNTLLTAQLGLWRQRLVASADTWA